MVTSQNLPSRHKAANRGFLGAAPSAPTTSCAAACLALTGVGLLDAIASAEEDSAADGAPSGPLCAGLTGARTEAAAAASADTDAAAWASGPGANEYRGDEAPCEYLGDEAPAQASQAVCWPSPPHPLSLAQTCASSPRYSHELREKKARREWWLPHLPLLCLRSFADACRARLQFILLLKAKAAKAVAKPKAPVAKHKAQIEKYRV